MKFSSLSNHELLELAVATVKKENELVADLVLTLREVARRKLFVMLGHNSMFDFCIRRLGMSEDQAYKRLQVSNMVERHPEALEMLRSGKAKLAHLALAAPRITPANAKAVFDAMKGRSKRQFAVELSSIGPDGTRFEKAEVATTKIIVEASDELMQAIERVTGLLIAKGKLRGTKPEDVVSAMAEFVLDRVDPVRKAKRVKERQAKKAAPEAALIESAPGQNDLMEETASSNRAKSEPRPRYIPAAERHAVVLRGDGRCSFVGDDGTRCAATFGLQMDHNLAMFCEGGTHDEANLVEMCGPHNRLLAERRLGREFIRLKIAGEADTQLLS